MVTSSGSPKSASSGKTVVTMIWLEGKRASILPKLESLIKFPLESLINFPLRWLSRLRAGGSITGSIGWAQLLGPDPAALAYAVRASSGWKARPTRPT